MRIVVLGAGLMAQAGCWDLLQQRDVDAILIADSDGARAEALAARWPDRRLRATRWDAGDEKATARLLEGAAAAVSMVPYRFNPALAKAAVRAGCNFCDLGGNNDVVRAELALHAEARKAGVTIVPDCGLAPGMTALLVADAAGDFETLESVELRVGGLPQRRGGPLDYSLVFNIQGLINEYIEPAVVLEDGEPKTVECPGDFEELEFPEPFGRLEAFNTSGGVSTLPETYRGRVRRLNYKTIRYPGHGGVILAMKQLGLFSSAPVEVEGARVRPREVFAAVAGPALDRGEPDVTLLRATMRGKKGGRRRTRVYEMIEYPDPERGLSAMMRTTAYPATAVLMMLARGQAAAKGALPQERCVDPKIFLKELAARGLTVRIRTA
jgi:lysine 6-dehydrogenase